MGRNGIYFRQTLPSSDERGSRIQNRTRQAPSVDFQVIQSGSVAQMVDSSSAELLAEINSKAQKPSIWPWVLGLALAASCALLASDWHMAIQVTAFLLLVTALSGAIYWDKLRKTVVLFYELEAPLDSAYQKLHEAFGAVSSCSRVWHIHSQGKIITTYDWKTNAGAGSLINRTRISPSVGAPPYFQSNISIPFLSAGSRTLYFLPDRVLVWSSSGVGAVGYDGLNVLFAETRFIEADGVPSDSRVVGHTWRYVNVSGGPDRRFNNNRQIPIAIYEDIRLASHSGLQEAYQASKSGTGIQLKIAVDFMAQSIAASSV